MSLAKTCAGQCWGIAQTLLAVQNRDTDTETQVVARLAFSEPSRCLRQCIQHARGPALGLETTKARNGIRTQKGHSIPNPHCQNQGPNHWRVPGTFCTPADGKHTSWNFAVRKARQWRCQKHDQGSQHHAVQTQRVTPCVPWHRKQLLWSTSPTGPAAALCWPRSCFQDGGARVKLPLQCWRTVPCCPRLRMSSGSPLMSHSSPLLGQCCTMAGYRTVAWVSTCSAAQSGAPSLAGSPVLVQVLPRPCCTTSRHQNAFMEPVPQFEATPALRPRPLHLPAAPAARAAAPPGTLPGGRPAPPEQRSAPG